MIFRNAVAAILAAIALSPFCQQTDPEKFIEKLDKLRKDKTKTAKSICLNVRIMREGKINDNTLNESWTVVISPARLDAEQNKDAAQKFVVALLNEKGKPEREYTFDGRNMYMIDYAKKQYKLMDMAALEKEIPWFLFVFTDPSKFLTPDNMKILRVPSEEKKEENGDKAEAPATGKSNVPIRMAGIMSSNYDPNNYFVVELRKTQTLPERILELEKETAMPFKIHYDTYEFTNTIDFGEYVYTNEYEDVFFVRDPSNFKEVK